MPRNAKALKGQVLADEWDTDQQLKFGKREKEFRIRVQLTKDYPSVSSSSSVRLITLL